jgi:hypothetical protein
MNSFALAETKPALAGPVTVLGGLPFLDDAFASRRLLAAVAAVRHVRAERAGMGDRITDAEAEAWLAPPGRSCSAAIRRRFPPLRCLPADVT